MAIVAGCVVPHPPIVVPEIGGAASPQVAASRNAMEELAARVARLKPQTLVFISPHSQVHPDAIVINSAERLTGSLAAFGAAGVVLGAENDLSLVHAVQTEAATMGIPIVKLAEDKGSYQNLDHGVLVPYYFLERSGVGAAIASLSISYLSLGDHYRLGSVVRAAADKLKRSVIFIASGDLSHRLIPGAPAGYSPRGEQFDLQVTEHVRHGDFGELLKLDSDLVEDAGECGLRSVVALGGAFEGIAKRTEVLSYEGPFGVGYLVAWVEPSHQIAGVDSASR